MGVGLLDEERVVLCDGAHVWEGEGDGVRVIEGRVGERVGAGVGGGVSLPLLVEVGEGRRQMVERQAQQVG